MKTTCAVVTYSKCLYEHSYGRFIDSHDVVLRFNLHPYENATAHGTKTTHMMVNDAFWFEQKLNLWQTRGPQRFTTHAHFQSLCC